MGQIPERQNTNKNLVYLLIVIGGWGATFLAFTGAPGLASRMFGLSVAVTILWVISFASNQNPFYTGRP